MNFNKSTEYKGLTYTLISAFMYSTLPILVKLAYASGLGPGNTLFLRYVFSFLLLSVLIKTLKLGKTLIISPLIIAQGLFLTIGGLFYFFALESLSAGLTTVIFFIYPVLVAILSLLIYKEPFVPRIFVGLVLAITGIILLTGLKGESSLPANGVIFALLSCLCYTLYSLIGHKTVTSSDPLSITATLSLLAILIIGPFYHNELTEITHLTWQQTLITLSMACLNTLMAVLFFLKGVKHIGATRATLISTAEPAFCIILAYIILGETLTTKQFIGTGLVFASMFLAVRSNKRANRDQVADSMEHL